MENQNVNKNKFPFSLTAVSIGALVGVGVGFLLNLFNLSIGMTSFTVSDAGVSTIAIGGFIGVLIATLVSTFLTGWVSGYLGAYQNSLFIDKSRSGMLYGFISWFIALFIMAYIALPLLHYSVNYKNFLTNPSQALVSQMMSHSNNAISLQSAKDEASDHDQAKNLSAGLFAIFILALIGAITSCIGSYWAICTYEYRTHASGVNIPSIRA